MKNLFIFLAVLSASWFFFYHPKANWEGQLAPDDPIQTVDHLPPAWSFKNFTFTAMANYHIKAVILSKHHYWGEVETEDTISYYDLALGWGPMSDAKVINQLNISQGGRWYNYSWNKMPPIVPTEIISHSSNNHIISSDPEVLEIIQHFNRFDLIELEGYLVDITSNKHDWKWNTSLSRTDSAGGSCEVFWVTRAFSIS